MESLKKVSSFWLILIIVILPGIFVSLIRSIQRIEAEQKDNYVETVVDFDEFRLLARKDGLSLDEIFFELKNNGASSVAISEDTLASLELEGKITILSTKEIRKLSLEETYEIKLPDGVSALAALWVFCEDEKLLDRINQNLLWKLDERNLIRVHKNLLLINKSGTGFTEKVGLGFSQEYFDYAKKYDLGVVIRVFNYPGLNEEAAAKIVNFLPQPASISALLFADEEMLGERCVKGEFNKIIELFRNRSYRIGWIEFDSQEGIKSYFKILRNNCPFIRIHSISRKELDQVYTPERAVARWVRAVKDRSLKMLYFRCFLKDDKKYISNWTDYNLKYLNNTVKELNKNGFSIALGEQRLYEPKLQLSNLNFVSAISLCIALILGLAILLKLSYIQDLNGFTVLIFTVFTIISYILFPITTHKISGIIGAICYSCIGFLLATDSLQNEKFSKHGLLIKSAIFLLLIILPSIFGGFLIVGLYSNPEYLLKFNQFHGVKLSFIVPLIFTVTWSLKKYGNNVFDLLQKPMTITSFLVLSAVIGSLFLYIIRSDNTTLLKPTALEDRTRTFLENTLISRPRNKEFLVGYPAAILFVMFALNKELMILPLLALFIQMGQVSVVNTFCHFHTRLLITILRVINGLWLGILIGLALIIIIKIFKYLKNTKKVNKNVNKKKSILIIGYFGFGNVGDELLLKTYIEQFSKKYTDYKINVLTNKTVSDIDNPNIQTISRKNIITFIKELIFCQAIVVPGGGVFQSATSCKSLFYYYFLIWLGKRIGAKIILPAQGIGPWNNNNFFCKLLHEEFASELKKADYLTVRDNSSLNRLRDITSPDYVADLTTDLVFLNPNFSMKKHKKKIEFMHIYAVLRSSVKGSLEIANELIKLAKDSENIDLVPVSFQPNEDSEVWIKAGWTGEIKSVDKIENIFDDADLVISMRLHGCIISTIMGIPWIGLSYDPKVSSFADNCNWSEFCHSPDEANTEFFENSINKLAFHYSTYSDKLISFSEKMHNRAEKDFINSCEVITKTITVILFLLLFNTSAYAQNHFPSWMDDVKFEKSSSNEQFNGPVDPETGKTVKLESKINKKFKPKLPDFSKLREKSNKVSSETTNINQVSSYSTSLSTNGNDYLSTLSTGLTILNAINQIASETSSKTSNKNEEEMEEFNYRRQRTYKPGQFKSFYLESKEAEKKKMEENK